MPGRSPGFLMGHSLGGNLVLHHRLAGKEKVAGTVASSPALILANPKPPAIMMLLRAAARLLPALIVPNRLDPAGLSRHRPIAVEYRSDPWCTRTSACRQALT